MFKNIGLAAALASVFITCAVNAKTFQPIDFKIHPSYTSTPTSTLAKLYFSKNRINQKFWVEVTVSNLRNKETITYTKYFPVPRFDEVTKLLNDAFDGRKKVSLSVDPYVGRYPVCDGTPNVEIRERRRELLINHNCGGGGGDIPETAKILESENALKSLVEEATNDYDEIYHGTEDHHRNIGLPQELQIAK